MNPPVDLRLPASGFLFRNQLEDDQQERHANETIHDEPSDDSNSGSASELHVIRRAQVNPEGQRRDDDCCGEHPALR